MKILAFGLLLVLALMTWQHSRYLDARRNAVQDTQAMLYSSDAFHVATFVELPDGADLIESVGVLVDVLETAGGELVYAGQAAFTGPSEQIGPHDWDAAILVQYASRGAYDQAMSLPEVRDTLETFPAHYSHGLERSPIFNLLIPQALLALRITDIARGHWTPAPLEPAPEAEWDPKRRDQLPDAVRRLRAARQVNDEAVLVFNLTRAGNSEQRENDRAYGLRMLRRMAALRHGPMHIGQAVVLQDGHDFEQAVLVYYPGPGYFADLLSSSFFQGIIGHKQLGDNQSVATVPIRALLR